MVAMAGINQSQHFAPSKAVEGQGNRNVFSSFLQEVTFWKMCHLLYLYLCI